MPYKDPEKLREYQRLYREENREHLLEYNRLWQVEHRERILELKKNWRDKNKPKLAEYKKRYCRENKELICENVKEWRKTEKGKACVQRANMLRYVREIGTVNTLTFNEWQDILEDYNYKCAYCGREFNSSSMPTRDHVIPLSRGGNNTKENIKPACKSCNSKKHTKLIEEILSTLNNK